MYIKSPGFLAKPLAMLFACFLYLGAAPFSFVDVIRRAEAPSSTATPTATKVPSARYLPIIIQAEPTATQTPWVIVVTLIATSPPLVSVAVPTFTTTPTSTAEPATATVTPSRNITFTAQPID